MADDPLDDLADRDAPCRCRGGEKWSKYCPDHHGLAADEGEAEREAAWEARNVAATALENRRTALMAAGMAWGGMSSVRDRDGAILDTAEKMLEWLVRP